MKRTQISENVFVLGNENSGVIVQATGWRDQSFGEQFGWDHKFARDTDHVKWGPADNMPNVMRKLLNNNNMIQSQLTTWRDMIWGAGPRFYTKVIEDNIAVGKPIHIPALEEWATETDLEFYEIAAINQFVDNANIFTRVEWDFLTGRPKLEVSDSFSTRIIRTKPGNAKMFGTNPYFGEMQIFNTKETEFLQAFNAREIDTDLVQILHQKVPIPGQPFYSFPTWWTAADWVELANLIPKFHISGIKNGYNIKYLIRMPKDYFSSNAGGKKLSDEEEKAAWEGMEAGVRGMLSGEDNVNKSMFIKYLRGGDGKMLDNIDIIPLKNEMSDNAYAVILEMTNLSITNSMSLMPTLSGTNPGKGNDSGSQVRVMADYQQHFRTAIVRKVVLDGVNKAIRMMGYKDVYRAFDGVQITTLDDNPNGTQKVTTQAA